eukprot:5915938-Amphidinium_carterae.1
MLVSRGLEVRKQETEAMLLTETQSLKGTLNQVQGAARAFQEKTRYFEEIAKTESIKASQLKEERTKDLEANFRREVTQREEALKAELDVARKTEQAAVRDACNKVESAASRQFQDHASEDRMKSLVSQLVTEQREKERLAKELELERAKWQRQAEQSTTFHSISTPRKASPSLVDPERCSSGVEQRTGTSSGSTEEESDKLSPLPSPRRRANSPKKLKGIVTMTGTRTATQTKTNTRVKSSVANSTRGGSSMPSRRDTAYGGNDEDGSGNDDDGEDKRKKKKDHHSPSDSSDSDSKNKKKKRKKSSKKKKKKSYKSHSLDRKVKKKTNKHWGSPDDTKHPWDRREDDDPTRIPGPSYIPEPVRKEMLTH